MCTASCAPRSRVVGASADVALRVAEGGDQSPRSKARRAAPRLVSRLHVNDAGAAARRAVLGVRLPHAAAAIDVDLFRLAAERARDAARGAGLSSPLLLHPVETHWHDLVGHVDPWTRSPWASPLSHARERYRSHESGNTVTTGPSTVPFAATRRAATTAVPDEPPTSRPSSRMRRRVIAKLSSSETLSAASMTVRSRMSGGLRDPIPSTSYGASVRRPRQSPSERDPSPRIGEHDADTRQATLEEPTDTADGSLGPGAGHEGADAAPSARRALAPWSSRARTLAGLQNWSVRNHPCSCAMALATFWKLSGLSGGALSVMTTRAPRAERGLALVDRHLLRHHAYERVATDGGH